MTRVARPLGRGKNFTVPTSPQRSPLWLVGKRWCAFRQFAKSACLFESVGKGEESGLSVVEAQQFGTDRHTERRRCGRGGEPTRKGNRWEASPAGKRAVPF